MHILRKILTNAAVFAVVFMIVSVSADLYYHHQLSHQKPEKKGWTCRCDFRVYWTAGYRLNNFAFSFPGRQGATAYEKELDEYLDGNRDRVYDRSESFYHFRYSPITAFFMSPFALIAYPATSLMAWFVALNIALLASLALLVRQISSDFNISLNVRYAILWSAFIVSLRFYLMDLSVGQCDVFIALLFAAFLAAYLRGNEILCGIIFAIVIQFKPIFFPMGLYFLSARKRKLALSAFLGTVVLLFAPAVIIGFGKTWELLNGWAGILNMSVPSQILNYKNQSITYFICKSVLGVAGPGLPISAEKLFYITGALLTICAYAALLLLRRSSGGGADKKFKYLEVSILIIVSLLFSPLVWVSHFICLLVPAGVMVLFLSTSRNKAPLYAPLAGFVFFSLVAGTDITRFIPVFNKGRFVNIALGAVFLSYALVRSYKEQSRNE